MTKGVLVHGSKSKYDDEPGKHYHFPKRYLKRIEAIVDDWFVYFTPVKDASIYAGCYTAVAKLASIRPDPSRKDHYYVDIAPQTFSSFAFPVARSVDGRFVEKNMQKPDGSTNTGVAQQAVRHIDEIGFEKIITLGWLEDQGELPRLNHPEDDYAPGLEEIGTDFEHDAPREIISTLLNRKTRDRRFRLAILSAYNKTCAMTGWSFINGGGRAEVEAAHIKPVEHDGPDSINNGIALSGTVHWMFDRGLVSVGDDHEILISTKVNDIDGLNAILNPTRRILAPKEPEYEPHPAFLKWHREMHGF